MFPHLGSSRAFWLQAEAKARGTAKNRTCSSYKRNTHTHSTRKTKKDKQPSAKQAASRQESETKPPPKMRKKQKKNALFGSLEDKEGQDNDRQHRKQQPFQKKGKKRNTTRNNQNGQIKSQTQAAKKTNRPAKKPTS
jgi:hypothetical protein